MRFLIDECTGPAVAAWLRRQKHEVLSVFDEARGVNDDAIVQKAEAENRILVTNDKDFATRVFRDGRLRSGVILLRLHDERPACKIRVLQRLLGTYSDRLPDSFVVVTESQVRFGRNV